MITYTMHQEWAATATSAPALAALADWQAECLGLADCKDLNDVLVKITADSDRYLGFLIGRHQSTGDALAGRCVLQAMIGVLIRRTANALDPAAEQGDLAAQMWIRIATYPLTNRPRKIAANLAMDTWKWAVAQWRGDREGGDIPVDSLTYYLDSIHDDDLDTPPLTPGAYQVLRIALQRGYLTAESYELLLTVYGPDGTTSRDTGTKLGISADAVRWRCSTTIRRHLRPHADEIRASLAA